MEIMYLLMKVGTRDAHNKHGNFKFCNFPTKDEATEFCRKCTEYDRKYLTNLPLNADKIVSNRYHTQDMLEWENGHPISECCFVKAEDTGFDVVMMCLKDGAMEHIYREKPN